MQQCIAHDQQWKIRRSAIDSFGVLEFLLLCVGREDSSYRKVLALLGLARHCKLAARSSFCAARRKVGWVFIRNLLHVVARQIESFYGERYLWCGRPVFAIDGTKVNLPHELKKLKYKATHRGCFYPQALVTTLVRLKSNIPWHFIVSRHTNEICTVGEHLRQTPEGAVIVCDRLYLCINVLKTFVACGREGVFRLRTGGTLKEITDFIASGCREQIITINRPKQDLLLRLRLVRYKVKGSWYYLATTLLDSNQYPIQSLKDLYHARWGIEETYKFIKQGLVVERFHSKTSAGIKQEIGTALLITVLCKLLCMHSKTGRTKAHHHTPQASMGVAKQLLVASMPQLIRSSSSVQDRLIINIISQLKKQTHLSTPRRSFPRRSRKVINRWQKNIAKSWKKKQSQLRQGLRP